MARTLLLAPLAAGLLLAGCARSEEASLVPPDDASLSGVETVRTPERDDEEIALGDWRESVHEDRPVLEFGPNGAPPLFSLSCDDRRGLVLQRHGAVPQGDLPMMLVTIGSETRRLPLTVATGGAPMLRATLAANDPLGGILAQATVPIAVRIGDTPPLILPPGPTVGTYVTRCATGEAGRGARGAAPAAPAEAPAPDATDGNSAAAPDAPAAQPAR